MSILQNDFAESAPFHPYRRLLLPPLVALVLTLAAALLAAQEPLLAVAMVVLLPLGLALFILPELATLTVLFLLYSNALIVSVKFHDVPKTVGGALPLALLGIPLITYLVFRRQKLIYHAQLVVLIAFYLLAQILGALFTDYNAEAFQSVIEIILEGIILYFLVINAIRTPATLRRAIWALLLAGLILGGVPIFQQITGTFDNNYAGFGQLSDTGFGTGEENIFGEVRQFRLAGSIGEKNRYAQIMLMLIPLGLYRFWGERPAWLRWLALLCTMVIGVGFVLAFSRGGAVSFVLIVVAMIVLRLVTVRQVALVALGTTVVLFAIPQYTARLASLQSIRAWISPESADLEEEPDGAIEGRTAEMLAAFYVFVDHPLVGVGPGVFPYYSKRYADRLDITSIEGRREAHSLYLDVAADNGLLGFVAFMGILVVTLRDLWRTRKRWLEERPELANMATSCLLAILAYLATGIFLHLSYLRYFWLIIALGSAAILVARNEETAVAGPQTA
ncbi:MAG: O-antigen ligase family protein [Chloroflexi bacterium]|nr:O-antigen ligase family protein [Chloroflexota bacterium]MCI0580719.1 O-antigen ligase family protein [Chloroflexota bacterium]MCI0646636.1 O-antigen ligase family protein [Chloroflexota bacterium]MCI0729219.1 O-antigen ligase family protein [Chloroflexota bacterium]